MGKKHRNRRKDSIDDDDDHHENEEKNDHDDHPDSRGGTEKKKNKGKDCSNKNSKMKDLDFAARRELQRKEAAEKRRAKMKCYVCGRTGHVRRECPGIQDDGRGMSRYKNKSDPLAYEKRKSAAKGGNQNQQQQRGRGTSIGSQHDAADGGESPKLDYPEAVFRRRSKTSNLSNDDDDDADGSPAVAAVPPSASYFDVSCDVDATIEYCKQGRGKHKISFNEAVTEYRSVLKDAVLHTNFAGMISKTVLKPNRPWIRPTWSLEDDQEEEEEEEEESTVEETMKSPRYKTFYQVGLSSGFLTNNNSSSDEEMEAVIDSLVETLQDNDDIVVGYWSVLDFRSTNAVNSKPSSSSRGCDVESQKRRVIATCKAAGKLGVTVQIQVLPGASSLEDTDHVSGTDYARVLLSLTEILTDITTEFPDLQIIVADWSGLAPHMLSLIQTFPNNVTIGFDGTVSFTKAKHVHECAFDVPIDKMVLMTSTTIPAEIANTLGRDAFFHSGLWSFVAASFAQYKEKMAVTIDDVVSASFQKTTQLYPQLLIPQEQQPAQKQQQE